ncbi:Hypothetical protein PBC10988_24880 [Planctomycetales bacterium 10988]|nr:Hypothetical protein PBC10988_24880 [Planctomycetales bacterium 10988]
MYLTLRKTWTFALVVTLLAGVASSSLQAREKEEETSKTELKYPAYVTEYDIATRDALYYDRMVRPLIQGDDPGEWEVLYGLADQVGGWVDSAINPQEIAAVITQAMSIEGQPLDKLDHLVADCAKILHVPKPAVFIKNDYAPRIYLANTPNLTEEADDRILVMTSELLKLFEERPHELRFLIGRELAHIKCDTEQTRFVFYGLFTTIRGIDLNLIPADYRGVLPTLALGRFFSWAREMEISADRAGLLCCQDPQVAYQALARLLHGLQADSDWIDPENPDFNTDKIVKEYRQWEDQTFVSMVKEFKESSRETPFIPERLAALKMWADTGSYQKILDRESGEVTRSTFEIQAISIDGMAAEEDPVDAYLIGYTKGNKIFESVMVEDATEATWREMAILRAFTDGQPLFVEIWDSNYTFDSLVAGFVVYPEKGKNLYTTQLVWDWQERTNKVRSNVVKVRLKFEGDDSEKEQP